MTRPILLLAVLALVSVAPAQAPEIEQFVKATIRRGGVPGAAVAVVREGKLIYSGGFGLADLENAVPVTPETVFQLGSMTKQFTAALVMMLVQEGKLKLDEPAKTYLPELAQKYGGVTVRHLLTHTSGIPSYTSISGFQKLMKYSVTPAEFFRYVLAPNPDFAPGAKWQYNNSGYFLLGLLLERVSGKSYAALIHDKIAGRLGMGQTQVNDAAKLVQRRARGYSPTSTGPANAESIDMAWPFSAGALLSSVVDLAKWDAALYDDKFLSPDSRKAMWSPVGLSDGSTFPYGFGWGLEKVNGIAVLEHGGDIPGFNSNIERVPSKRLTVIALCNADPGVAEKLTAGVLGIVDPALKVQPPKPLHDENPALSARLRSVLEDLLRGVGKESDFSTELWARIRISLTGPEHDQLASLGKPLSFVLELARSSGGQNVRRYRVKFSASEMLVSFAVGADGKIAGLLLGPG